MTKTIPYPLTGALGLSPVAGAVSDGEAGQVHVHPLEGWLITGELQQEAICEECEDDEWCSWYLAKSTIPEDNGWLPEPLRFIPHDEWMEG